ncbi:MAG TPA: hypothetical protein VN688_15130, partial [Gemmataceae bacterium]|nr:hypothetical protein [Gemmataceae bacterium]
MSRSSSLVKIFLRVFIALLLLGGVAGGLFFWVKYRPAHATESSPLSAPLPRIGWDSHSPDVIQLPADYTTALKVKTTTVKPAPLPEPLRLRGSLMLDANRLARVKCFFSGQVVSIGKRSPQSAVRSPQQKPATVFAADCGLRTADCGLRYGDLVKKDQVLAVVWSQTVGEKKSELVDAISHLETDQRVFDRYRKVDRGIIAEKDYDNARRNVEQDIIAVEKAERTLLSWRLSAPEIQAVRREAERMRERKEEDIATIRRE